MTTTQTERLLQVWESHAGAHPIQRSIALLAAVWPQCDEAQWARASVGQRDACLLSLRESLFGEALHTVARCPQCGERLESSFSTTDIRAAQAMLPEADAPLLHFSDGAYSIRFRLPNSEDLLAITQRSDAEPERALLRRCVVDAREHDREVDAARLPVEIARGIAARMAEADPAADLRIGLQCPDCGHAWSSVFDIAAYLWGELEDWAQALLDDVHRLARAYGWSERDILALSAARRQSYLDRVLA